MPEIIIQIDSHPPMISIKFPHREPYIIRDVTEAFAFLKSYSDALTVFEKKPEGYR